MSFFKRSETTVETRIRGAIDEMRPLLRIDTVGVELVSFEDTTGTAVLRFEGDCPDCRMSASMLRQGIEAHLRRLVPEVRAVRAADDEVS